MILVSGATATVRRIKKNREYLGVLSTPADRQSMESIVATGLPWAIDNGAFTGFRKEPFEKLIYAARETNREPMWIAAPDVVGDAVKTLEQFTVWEPIIRRQLGLRVALVGQDGLENLPVPWRMFDCLFLGGSTDWKLGQGAEALCREAKARKKLVHMGRVNTKSRIGHARRIGCDSVDGTGASRYPDTNIPKLLTWAAMHTKQLVVAVGGKA